MSSLFYRFFKAKFFPNTSVMEDKVLANALYAWKSLIKGRDVIKRGVRWRIGLGKSVYIWGDNWLPFKAAPNVVLPKVEGSGLTMVSDLIDPVYKGWNEDAIDRTFFAFEATTIKNIPLYRSIQDDVLLWPFNPDGVYIVKFGYRFLYDKQCRKKPSPFEVEVLKLLWNRIWGLHVPNKIKRLAWKACKNALPTKLNLVHHKIIMDDCCDACKTQQEDAVHALFLCPDLRPLWSSMPKWNHGTLRVCISFIDIFDCIFASNKDLDLFAAVIWTLWTRRNNLRLGKPALPLNKVIEFSRE